jgi:hypothetical protein
LGAAGGAAAGLGIAQVFALEQVGLFQQEAHGKAVGAQPRLQPPGNRLAPPAARDRVGENEDFFHD